MKITKKDLQNGITGGIISTLICISLLIASGCATRKPYSPQPEKQYITLSTVPADVMEIRYIRKNVDSGAYEMLSITPQKGKIERFGAGVYKPKIIQFNAEEFMSLAQDAVKLSWEAVPVRIRNKQLEEKITLKTNTGEESVIFSEDVSGAMKAFYSRIIRIRQNILKTKQQ